MKLTIELPDELHRRAEAEATLRGCALSDLIEESLHLVLDLPRDERSGVSFAERMKDSIGIVDSGVPDPCLQS